MSTRPWKAERESALIMPPFGPVMLRSQGIPTRLEVGYAGTVYHAWISTYIKDVGWINGIIQFNGSGWTLIDPTTASVKEKKEAQEVHQQQFVLPDKIHLLIYGGRKC